MVCKNAPKSAEGFKARQDEDRANARLIAAAPDLLAALQLAQTFCQQRGGSWAEFEAAVNSAIARATEGAS